ncbi:MAG TPA: hypothetical protein VM914_12340, partial [Pyrinomonadaceae bacterium]|nr:hypothetical protein [Pyrinomonadaceae bacterium]
MDEKAQEILKSLAEDVAEAASYLRELGVEGLEGVSSFEVAPQSRAELPTKRAQPPAQASPALRRNATAERPPPPPPIKRTLPPPPTRPKQAAEEPPDILYQSDHSAMPTKRPVRAPSPDPPAPRETLFGDITPKDELSLGHPSETFEDIREDIGECVRCPLHQGRTKIVHTEGNQKARLLFVGEAPGAD